jgi:hypothetical protein
VSFLLRGLKLFLKRAFAAQTMSLVVWPFIVFSLGASASTDKLEIQLDKSKIRLGEVVTLLIRVRGEGSQFEVKNLNYDLEGLNAITKSQGSQLSSLYENGRFLVKRRFDFRIVLEASAEGKASIRNIKVETTQGVLQHDDLFVEVLPPDPSNNNFQGLTQNQQPKEEEPSSAQSRLQGGAFFAPEGAPSVFVAVETNKTKAVINEEIFVTYWAYRKVNIRDFLVSKWPNLPGFWKQQLDLRTSFNWEPVQYEGELFYRTPVAEYAVFPVRAGTVEIDRLEIEGKMVMGSSGGLNVPGFPTFGGRTIPFKKDNRPIEIQVEPLPEKDKPKNFSNLVGQFNASLKSSVESLKVGETFKLFLEITGRGNLRLLEEVPYRFPSGWDFFNTKRRTRYRPVKESEAEFEMIAIPEKPGSYELGPIKISYFNPISGRYEVSQTQSIKIEVAPGTLPQSQDEQEESPAMATSKGRSKGRSSTGSNAMSATEGSDFRPDQDSVNKLTPITTTLSSDSILQKSKTLLWLVWLLVGIFALGMISRLLLDRYQKTQAFKDQEKARRFKIKLKGLRKAVERGDLSEVDETFREILADYLGYKSQDMTLDSMRAKGLNEEAQIIEQLQKALYSSHKAKIFTEKKQVMRHILDLASSKTPQKTEK